MKDASKRLIVFSTVLGLLLICAGVLIPYLGEIELMLAPEKLLINPTSDSAAASWVYSLEQTDDGLQDYITGLIPA